MQLQNSVIDVMLRGDGPAYLQYSKEDHGSTVFLSDVIIVHRTSVIFLVRLVVMQMQERANYFY
jgi:hypothetical protein